MGNTISPSPSWFPAIFSYFVMKCITVKCEYEWDCMGKQKFYHLEVLDGVCKSQKFVASYLMYISLLCVQGGSAGSESGGSGVDSITGEHNVSGRSSAYGDNVQEPLVGARSETSSLGAPAGFQVCV